MKLIVIVNICVTYYTTLMIISLGKTTSRNIQKHHFLLECKLYLPLLNYKGLVKILVFKRSFFFHYFLLIQIEFNKDTFIAFIDLEKDFDKVPWKGLFYTL